LSFSRVSGARPEAFLPNKKPAIVGQSRVFEVFVVGQDRSPTLPSGTAQACQVPMSRDWRCRSTGLTVDVVIIFNAMQITSSGWIVNDLLEKICLQKSRKARMQATFCSLGIASAAGGRGWGIFAF
jgi:hypothetical protein